MQNDNHPPSKKSEKHYMNKMKNSTKIKETNKQMLQLNNTMTELKKLMKSINTRFDQAEELVHSKTDHSIIYRKKKTKRTKNLKTKESLQDLQDTMHYWSLKRRREKEKDRKFIFKNSD